MTSPVGLLAAIGTHLAALELPATASVPVAAAISPPQLTVHLACQQPSAIAQGLLAWADTLTKVAAKRWRVPRGDSAHPSRTGLLPCDAAVLTYGGLPATHRSLGADRTPDATTPIPLAARRHTATDGEGRA